MKRVKRIVSIVITLVIALSTIYLVGFSDISFYPYSRVKIAELSEQLSRQQESTSDNNARIKALQGDVDNKEEQFLQYEKTNRAKLAMVESLEWRSENPELLILLEQNAKELDVDITIFYDYWIKDHAEVDEYQEVNRVMDSIKAPAIEGVSIKPLPITLSGEYGNIQKYLQIIDNIDFIEPRFIELEINNAEQTDAVVIIYSFNEEEVRPDSSEDEPHNEGDHPVEKDL